MLTRIQPSGNYGGAPSPPIKHIQIYIYEAVNEAKKVSTRSCTYVCLAHKLE